VEKTEAAKFLGVSTRTLERMVVKGLLSPGRKKGKTRPVVVFDRAALERLKANLGSTQTSGAPALASPGKPKETVAFRLDPHYMKRLEDRSMEEGVSAGDMARTMVVRSLESGDEVAKLRRGLQEMFYILLVSKMEVPEAEAEDMVRQIGEVV